MFGTKIQQNISNQAAYSIPDPTSDQKFCDKSSINFFQARWNVDRVSDPIPHVFIFLCPRNSLWFNFLHPPNQVFYHHHSHFLLHIWSDDLGVPKVQIFISRFYFFKNLIDWVGFVLMLWLKIFCLNVSAHVFSNWLLNYCVFFSQGVYASYPCAARSAFLSIVQLFARNLFKTKFEKIIQIWARITYCLITHLLHICVQLFSKSFTFDAHRSNLSFSTHNPKNTQP